MPADARLLSLLSDLGLFCPRSISAALPFASHLYSQASTMPAHGRYPEMLSITLQCPWRTDWFDFPIPLLFTLFFFFSFSPLPFLSLWLKTNLNGAQIFQDDTRGQSANKTIQTNKELQGRGDFLYKKWLPEVYELLLSLSSNENYTSPVCYG